MLHEPSNPTGEAMALTHGAGGDCNSALLLAIAEAFTQAGVAVLRFNLAFRELSRPPSPATGPKDRDSIRQALESLRSQTRGPLYLASQSYGGRQASILAAEEPQSATALALFSYPLHPPKKANQMRTDHFPQLSTPALFIHGPRDPFATIEELEAARKLIPAPTAIHEVPKAGHDLLRGRFAMAPVISALRALAALAAMAAVPLSAQTTHKLPATPKTVVVGYYSAAAPPALRIKSGDTVEIETVSGSGKRLEAAGAKGIPQSLYDINDKVTDKGPGGHILTGPVFVEGAEPGDTLEVRIVKIDLAVPFAYNAFRPGSGFLPDDFPYSRFKVIPLDRARMVAQFAPGIEIPLHPFFGSMGVAPPEGTGRLSSTAPWYHAGNMDNKELVAGTTLFIPVQAKGALFEVGDAHAGQGNGEVDITALETSLNGTFQFIVRKDMHLKWPRAETPTHYITMGFHEDLTEATTLATRDMIDFLVTEKHLSRDDAYMLTSVAADLSISQLVDTKKGVHASIPKNIFVAR